MGVKYIEDVNDEAMDAWITALRSGEYKQTRRELASSSGSLCCLGVLGVIQDCTISSADHGLLGPDGRHYSWLPPQSTIEALGLPEQYVGNGQGHLGAYVKVDSIDAEDDDEIEEGVVSVTFLNDTVGLDFNGIADRLEATFLRKEGN